MEFLKKFSALLCVLVVLLVLPEQLFSAQRGLLNLNRAPQIPQSSSVPYLQFKRFFPNNPIATHTLRAQSFQEKNEEFKQKIQRNNANPAEAMRIFSNLFSAKHNTTYDLLHGMGAFKPSSMVKEEHLFNLNVVGNGSLYEQINILQKGPSLKEFLKVNDPIGLKMLQGLGFIGEVFFQNNPSCKTSRTFTVGGEAHLIKLLMNPSNKKEEILRRQALLEKLLSWQMDSEGATFLENAQDVCGEISKVEEELVSALDNESLQKTFRDHYLSPNLIGSAWMTPVLMGQRFTRTVTANAGMPINLAKQAALSSLFGGLFNAPDVVPGSTFREAFGSFGRGLAGSFVNEEWNALKPMADQFGFGAISEFRQGNYLRAGIMGANPVSLFSMRPLCNWIYGQEFTDGALAPTQFMANVMGSISGSNLVVNLLLHKNEYWSTDIGKAESQVVELQEKIFKLKSTWEKLKGFALVAANEVMVIDSYFDELELALASSSFVRTNRLVQHFWKHMMLPDDQNPLRLFLHRVSELDAFCAFARYLTFLVQDGKPVCKATLVDSTTPVVELKGGYHPLLAASGVDPVPNDLTFNDKMRSMFLVAPNSSGKSGLVEMYLLNVLFAQVTGWSFAKSCKLAVFDEIWSYKKVDEDMESGASTGQAQVSSIAKLTGDIRREAARGKKILFIGDEVASGLSRKGAGKILFAKNGLFESLETFPSVCSVIISHFNLQKKIQTKFPSFKHYHMDVLERNGKFIPQFKLKPGSGFWLSSKKENKEKRDRFIVWYLGYLKKKALSSALDIQKERLFKQFGVNIGGQIYSNILLMPENQRVAAIESMLKPQGGAWKKVEEETIEFENYPHLLKQPGCEKAATISSGQFDRETVMSLPHSELLGIIGEKNSLYQEIVGPNGERLKTASGRLELFKWLSSPTNSPIKIKQRQDLIDYLLSHPRERQELKDLCAQFATVEQQVGSTIDPARLGSIAFLTAGFGMVQLPTLLGPGITNLCNNIVQLGARPGFNAPTTGFFANLAHAVDFVGNRVVMPVAHRVRDFGRDSVRATTASRLALMGAGFGGTLAMAALTKIITVPFQTGFRAAADVASNRGSLSQGIRMIFSETVRSLVPSIPSKDSTRRFLGQLTGINAYRAFSRGDRVGGTLSLLRTIGVYGLCYLTYRSFINQYQSSMLGRAEQPIIRCIDGLYTGMGLYDSMKSRLGTLSGQFNLPQAFVKDIRDACAGNIITRPARKIEVFSSYAGGKKLFEAVRKGPGAQNDVQNLMSASPIQKLFEDVAFIDACCAFTDYFEMLSGHGIPVCKAEFVKSNEVSVELTGAVHPLVAKYKNYSMQDIVPNDFSFSKNSRNEVLTAHNSSGKSVALQTALQNMILAQVSGYAVCTTYKGVIFDRFAIYKKIDEEMSKQLSTGAAQTLNVIGLDALVRRAAANDEKLFIVLDEPGSGTPEKVAEGILVNKDVLGLFNTLDTHKNVASCTATHFKFDLSKFKSFSRYHMQVDHVLNPDGSYAFTRRYKINPGAGIWLSNKLADKKVVDAYMDAYLDSIINSVADESES